MLDDAEWSVTKVMASDRMRHFVDLAVSRGQF